MKKFEQPEVPTEEEILKERALNDAKLLRYGAEYKTSEEDPKESPRIEVTKRQIKNAKKEMEESFDEERKASDKELIAKGAKYEKKRGKEKVLVLKKKQINKIKKDYAGEEKAAEQKRADLLEELQTKKAERYGFKDSNIKKTIAKGLLDTVGSVLGARLAWELPKYVGDVWKKKGANDAAKELLDEVAKRNLSVGRKKDLDVEVLSSTGKVIYKGPVTEELTDSKGKKYVMVGGMNSKISIDKIRAVKDTTTEDKPFWKKGLSVIKEGFNKIIPDRFKNESKKENETESAPVREKIAAFNEKLKNVKLPAAEKQELRNQLARLLWENRTSSKKISEARNEKVADVFDVYANNSAQLATVAKEAVNTVSIVTMMPWLRTIGYLGGSVGEAALKASNNFDKKHFEDKKDPTGKEKLSAVAREITIGSVKETYQGIIGNFFNKETYKKGKLKGLGVAAGGSLLKSFSLAMSGLRLAGVAEFAMHGGDQAIQEGSEKFWALIKEGRVLDGLTQGGENWVDNAQRMLSYVHLAENPDKAMRDVVHGTGASQADKMKGDFQINPAEAEQMRELATVHKGEGIIHTFQRQIEHDPKAFGFTGDPSNHSALHQFASRRAYGLAIENGYVDPTTGNEVRIRFDADHPASFVLKPDHTVDTTNVAVSDTYIDDAKREVQRALAHHDQTLESVQSDLTERINTNYNSQLESINRMGYHPTTESLSLSDNGPSQAAPSIDNNPTQNIASTEAVRAPLHQNIAETNHEQAKSVFDSVVFSESKPFKAGSAEFIFQYNKAHEVVGMRSSGEMGLIDNNTKYLFLKEGWQDTVFSNSNNDSNLKRDRLDMYLKRILLDRKGLNQFISEGKGDTPEAQFLKRSLMSMVSRFQRTFGDIIRTPDEILKIKS